MPDNGQGFGLPDITSAIGEIESSKEARRSPSISIKRQSRPLVGLEGEVLLRAENILDFTAVPSPHIIVCGPTGRGKTWATKQMIINSQLQASFVVLDPHDEYTDARFLERARGRVHYVEKEGLPVNVLQIPRNGKEKVARPLVVCAIVDRITRIFPAFGHQQRAVLYRALDAMLQKRRLFGDIRFSDLPEYIERECPKRDLVNSIVNPLRTIFELRLFDSMKGISSHDLFDPKRTSIISFKLYGENRNISLLTCVFVVNGVFDDIRQLSNHANRKVLVVDEFHGVATDPIFERIERESRKFNLGLWAVSQSISDFEDTKLIQNAGHIVAFRPFGGDEMRKTATMLSGDDEMKRQVMARLESLGRYEALFVRNSHERVLLGKVRFGERM